MVTVAGLPVGVAPLTGSWERTVAATPAPPAHLTQRRYDDDSEVKGRALARGERWIPPLGPERPDGPLEPSSWMWSPTHSP